MLWEETRALPMEALCCATNLHLTPPFGRLSVAIPVELCSLGFFHPQ